MSLIELERVNLVYPIRENAGVTLKEYIVRGLFRKYTDKMKSVHILKDMSLRIENGERVGIIGYNGAGKSSLLRTMGGVYPLESGRRNVSGSVCALFDIKLGFEMDATGMNNIFYRCYMQGETPQMVQKKVQDIVSFSELGEFIDVPVRCYSSGMLMRLAFSIATSSEPDVLLVDEVFSTGDQAFKAKAEERMRSLLKRANIVVMVGHDLPLLEHFCSRVLWLHKGHIRMDGSPDKVIAAYKENAEQHQAQQAQAA